MRIALVSPYDFAVPGGVNNHIVHLARSLESRGHCVHIIAPASDGRASAEGFINASASVIAFPFAGSIARITLSPRLHRRIKGILQSGAYDVLHLPEPLTPALPLAVLRHRDLVPCAIAVGTFHAYRAGPITMASRCCVASSSDWTVASWSPRPPASITCAPSPPITS